MNTPRHVASCAIAIGTLLGACAKRTSAPAPAPESATGRSVVPAVMVVARDSTGRVIPNGSSLDRDANDAADRTNRRVRTLHVVPSRLAARVGDTLAPAIALAVSGTDSAGRRIPRVIPLFGPFRPGGVLRALGDGRWLAVKPGTQVVPVRVMRFTQAPSSDTALVRSVLVEIVP